VIWYNFENSEEKKWPKKSLELIALNKVILKSKIGSGCVISSEK